MDSRIVSDPKVFYEYFLEVAAPTSPDAVATISRTYPEECDQDTKKQAPVFCYACTPERGAVQHFAFVLTDGDGKYRFGFCRYPPDANTCLCFISYLPWFELFYSVLDKVAELRLEGQVNLITPLLSSLHQHEIPPAGERICIVPEGENSGQVFSFATPDTTKLPCIPEAVNLTEYVTNIDPIYILHLFAAMLFERRILITSSKLSLVSACVHAAAQLLYPLNWQHIFIPIMPARLVDYCCAPMPFLVGVHSSVMQKIRKMPLDEVVILDCDANTLEISYDDLSIMPSDVVGPLKDMLKKHTSALDDTVPKAFLDAFVFMIGGYRDALRFREGEQIKFDAMAFIESRPKHVQPFLQKVLHLQQFQQFMMERLHRLNMGKGLSDLFENAISDSSQDSKHYLSKYTAWIKSKSKKGMAEVSTVLPSMKTALVTISKRTKKGIKGVKRFIDEIGQEDEDPDSPSAPTRPMSIGMPTLISTNAVSPEDLANGRVRRTATMPAQMPRGGRPPPVVPYSAYKASRDVGTLQKSQSSASFEARLVSTSGSSTPVPSEEQSPASASDANKQTLLAMSKDGEDGSPLEGAHGDLVDLSLPPVVTTSRTRTLSMARELFINFDEVISEKTAKDGEEKGKSEEEDGSFVSEFDPLRHPEPTATASSSTTASVSSPFESTPLASSSDQWANFDSMSAQASLNGPARPPQPIAVSAPNFSRTRKVTPSGAAGATPFDNLQDVPKAATPTSTEEDPFAVDLPPKRGPPIPPYRPRQKAVSTSAVMSTPMKPANVEATLKTPSLSDPAVLQFDPLLN